MTKFIFCKKMPPIAPRNTHGFSVWARYIFWKWRSVLYTAIRASGNCGMRQRLLRTENPCLTARICNASLGAVATFALRVAVRWRNEMLIRYCEDCGEPIPFSEWMRNHGICDECVRDEVRQA